MIEYTNRKESEREKERQAEGGREREEREREREGARKYTIAQLTGYTKYQRQTVAVCLNNSADNTTGLHGSLKAFSMGEMQRQPVSQTHVPGLPPWT